MDDAQLVRWMAKVAVQSPFGCWLWTASLDHEGYARFTVDGKSRKGHVVGWEHVFGPKPPGSVLDHFVCEVKHCVNPMHVRPVTQQENLLRGDTAAARNKAKTHCDEGHPFTPANTIVSKKGLRNCRICQRRLQREWSAAKRDRIRQEGR